MCAAARTGEIGDGKIFVSPVMDIIRMEAVTLACIGYWHDDVDFKQRALHYAASWLGDADTHMCRPCPHSHTGETGATAERMKAE